MPKVSIQDIAERAGVSKGTVSLILNGKAKQMRISKSTCEKVRKLVEELNYHPNEVARSLLTGRTMTIGIVITDMCDQFFGYLTHCIQQQAKKYGYSLIVTNSNEDLADYNNAVTSLMNRQTDGIIVVPVDGGENITQQIIDREVPIVQIDRFYPQFNANYIIVDNYVASARAVEALVQKGCRKIAALCYGIGQTALVERKRGYVEVLERHHLFDKALMKDIDFANQEEEIRQAIIDIKHYPEKVDAIYFCSCRVSLIGLKYVLSEGIRIPEDMQILCFDKLDFLYALPYPIIYNEQPVREMGEKAVDILMEQINGSKEIHQQVFKTNIVVS